VRALLTGGKLSLTHLGRSLDGAAQTKHQIKAVDRLLGNRHLHGERDGIYQAIARSLLLGNKRPVIIVDWSDFELGREWLMIKAALPTGGRAIALYERVFPFKRYNSPGAHRDFLRALHAILPPDCRPIIVTDAGFRGPWFREVEKYGWDWVGRIRNKIKYYRAETGRWRFTDSLYPEATTVPRYVGEVALSRRHRYLFRLYLVRAYKTRVGSPSAARAKEAQHHDVSTVASSALVAGDVVTSRARQRAQNQADLLPPHANRRDLPRPQVPSLGFRSPLRAQQYGQASRDIAAARHARDSRRLAGRDRRSHAAMELAAAG